MTTFDALENRDQEGEEEVIDRVVRAVSLSEAVAPVGACLERALAGYILLTALGRKCRVGIGVGWDHDRRLRSHAWLESRGRILIGGAVGDLKALRIPGSLHVTVKGRIGNPPHGELFCQGRKEVKA
jgi:hypothetical protein